MLQDVKQSLTWVPETFDALAVSGFGQFFIVRGVRKNCRPPKIQMFGSQIFMFEPTVNLFSRYVSTDGSKRRYHSSRVSVDVAGRDSCWLFIYWCSKDLNEEFSSSQNLFLRRTPTS